MKAVSQPASQSVNQSVACSSSIQKKPKKDLALVRSTRTTSSPAIGYMRPCILYLVSSCYFLPSLFFSRHRHLPLPRPSPCLRYKSSSPKEEKRSSKSLLPPGKHGWDSFRTHRWRFDLRKGGEREKRRRKEEERGR